MDYKKYFYIGDKNFCSSIPQEYILDFDDRQLNDLYVDGNEFDRSNIFFILLNQYYEIKEKGLNKEVAHICYLMSYYLFIPATPPSSLELAIVYAKKAIQYNDTKDYREWLEYVKKGN